VAESDALPGSLANVADLEDLVSELHERVDARALEPGEDLAARASRLGSGYRSSSLGSRWPARCARTATPKAAIVLVRPSRATSPVSGLKIICGMCGAGQDLPRARLDLVQIAICGRSGRPERACGGEIARRYA
jgi:hypothetical protein